MSVPLLEVGAAYLELQPALDAAYARVMRSGRYLLGEELLAFEKEFASYCEVEHAVGVGNGLDALTLILRAIDLKAGDEVIVPAHTFIATWLAVVHAGGAVVPVDVDRETYNLDVACVRAALSPRTRAIVAVHLYGRPAEMNALIELAKHHGVFLIEDAAQAHGARYQEKRIGSLAHAAAFSFYPGKNLGAFGDGGAVTTNNSALAERVRRLRNYGGVGKYTHEELGVNSRLDELQAAFLRARLGHLDTWNSRRQNIAAHYDKAFLRRRAPSNVESVWHQYVLRLRDLNERDHVREFLSHRGIETGLHYPCPPHLTPAFSSLGKPRGAFPVTELLCDTLLSLPMGPQLSADAQQQVIEAIHSAVSS